MEPAPSPGTTARLFGNLAKKLLVEGFGLRGGQLAGVKKNPEAHLGGLPR
jgi:hypothetical protein